MDSKRPKQKIVATGMSTKSILMHANNFRHNQLINKTKRKTMFVFGGHEYVIELCASIKYDHIESCYHTICCFN